MLTVAVIATGVFFYRLRNVPLALVETAPASVKPAQVAAVNKAPTVPVRATGTPAVVGHGIIKFKVPFTAQAPFGEWSDPRQQDACEEASVLMAVSWARGETFTLQQAKEKILAMADWEQKKYDNYQDTSARDTVERFFKEYYNYQQAWVVENIKLPDIINQLEQGNLVIVPANGQALHNPFFTAPGPVEHMLLIIGYDYGTKEFITNEAGTRHGQDYRYGQDVLYAAIRDYPTGHHAPIVGIQKTMIVVQKQATKVE